MKLKNIFLTFILGSIWGFSSCSSEELVDVPGNNEIALSFSLAVNDIKTKGESSIATKEELQINNCHIAVFDNEENSKTQGKLITSFDFPGEGQSLSDPVNGVYTLATEQLIRTWGNSKEVKVLAIANIDEDVNKVTTPFEDCETYEDYQNVVVTSNIFKSENLVKVGEKVLTLDNEKTYTVRIDLTQLTVRLDFEGIKNLSSEADPPVGTLSSIKGLNKKSNIVITRSDEAENTLYDSMESKGNKKTFYTYENKNRLNDLVLTIDLLGKQYFLDLSNVNFVKGNRYIIKGTYHPTVSTDIKWSVLDWSSKEEINIGFN